MHSDLLLNNGMDYYSKKVSEKLRNQIFLMENESWVKNYFDNFDTLNKNNPLSFEVDFNTEETKINKKLDFLMLYHDFLNEKEVLKPKICHVNLISPDKKFELFEQVLQFLSNFEIISLE
jgi:hypothetical protein